MIYYEKITREKAKEEKRVIVTIPVVFPEKASEKKGWGFDVDWDGVRDTAGSWALGIFVAGLVIGVSFFCGPPVGESVQRAFGY